jgi:hypothetical protein
MADNSAYGPSKKCSGPFCMLRYVPVLVVLQPGGYRKQFDGAERG